MTLDGRNGGYGLTSSKALTGTNNETHINSILAAVKVRLFIGDSHFDDNLLELAKEAIADFEKITSTSVYEQTITLDYEYFKGKVKLPYPPHNAVTAITDYVVTGNKTKYLEGGAGESLQVIYTAGYAILPDDIKSILVKMVECRFKDESIGKYPQWLYSTIRALKVDIE